VTPTSKVEVGAAALLNPYGAGGTQSGSLCPFPVAQICATPDRQNCAPSLLLRRNYLSLTFERDWG